MNIFQMKKTAKTEVTLYKYNAFSFVVPEEDVGVPLALNVEYFQSEEDPARVKCVIWTPNPQNEYERCCIGVLTFPEEMNDQTAANIVCHLNSSKEFYECVYHFLAFCDEWLTNKVKS